jgi:hypothetical protein
MENRPGPLRGGGDAGVPVEQEHFAPVPEDRTPGRWEHPLFAMIHARSDGELDGIIAALEERSGLRDYLVLKSLREFKKKRVTYFSPAFDEWKKENFR